MRTVHIGLGQILGRKLVHDLAHGAGSGVETVAHLGIAIDEKPLPGHQHILENDHGIALVKAA